MWYAVSKIRNKFPKTVKFYYSAVVLHQSWRSLLSLELEKRVAKEMKIKRDISEKCIKFCLRPRLYPLNSRGVA